MNKTAIIYKTLLLSTVFIIISCLQLSALAQTETGMELFKYWEFKKAEDAFREAIKENPSDTHATYYLGLSLLMQEKYQGALKVLKKIKASGKAGVPNKGQLTIALSRAYLGLKKYPKALEYLNASEKAKADSTDIHTYRGAYYLEINDATKAVRELEKAIDLGSQNPYTYYHAGITYLRLGNPAKAVQMLEMFLKLAPYTPEAEKAKFLIDSLC